jgi:hypothetical protein
MQLSSAWTQAATTPENRVSSIHQATRAHWTLNSAQDNLQTKENMKRLINIPHHLLPCRRLLLLYIITSSLAGLAGCP